VFIKSKRAYHNLVMISWKVENPDRLFSEIKNKFIGTYTATDLRWSIEHNRCFVNKKIERFPSSILQKGDLISFCPEKKPYFFKDEKRVLFEDDYIFVYDKPPFLPCESLEKFTPHWLAHRLDRDTSGVLLLAKDRTTLEALEQQFKVRSIQKEYLVLVEGYPGKEGSIKGNMALLHKRQGAVMWGMAPQGLWSQTQWRCVRRGKQMSLLHCFPLTGRTHQIRVHLKHLGYPILGDYTYGSAALKQEVFRPLLHAYKVSVTHPYSGERLMFKADVSEDFKKNLLFDMQRP
jgi:23S rRNA pseudouridine955/2504/2580 synthase